METAVGPLIAAQVVPTNGAYTTTTFSSDQHGTLGADGPVMALESHSVTGAADFRCYSQPLLSVHLELEQQASLSARLTPLRIRVYSAAMGWYLTAVWVALLSVAQSRTFNCSTVRRLE